MHGEQQYCCKPSQAKNLREISGTQFCAHTAKAGATGVYIESGAEATLRHKSLIGNKGPGIYLESGALVNAQQNNIYGNDTASPIESPNLNCGIENASGFISMVATNNYWGSATGPGANPADAVCGVSGVTAFSPYSSTPFSVGGALAE